MMKANDVSDLRIDSGLLKPAPQVWKQIADSWESKASRKAGAYDINDLLLPL